MISIVLYACNRHASAGDSARRYVVAEALVLVTERPAAGWARAAGWWCRARATHLINVHRRYETVALRIGARLALRPDSSADECAGCIGACCENVLVPITGYDAWRIAKSNGLPLAAFSTIATTVSGSRGAFRLGEGFVALVLRRSLASPEACYFLGEMALGAKRCLIHPSRPRVCRSYPMRLTESMVVLRSDVVCRTVDWDLDRISQPLWQGDLTREAFESDVYERVLAVWNASGLQGLEVFGDFILGAFDSVDAVLRATEAASSGIVERLGRVTGAANRWIVEMRSRTR